MNTLIINAHNDFHNAGSLTILPKKISMATDVSDALFFPESKHCFIQVSLSTMRRIKKHFCGSKDCHCFSHLSCYFSDFSKRTYIEWEVVN